ncbi:MAG: hypothetical protein LBK66_05270 [Spirochaetaceae bacterium]|nr:hypothetical protein [Spirochaetaceae bacterium]
MLSKREKGKGKRAVSLVCQVHFSDPKARGKARFRYANAERMRTRWRARMQTPFANLKAEVEVRFGYANAERM